MCALPTLSRLSATAVLCFFFFLFFPSDFQICTLRQVLTLSRPSATAESEGFFFLKTQCHGTLAIAWSIYLVLGKNVKTQCHCTLTTTWSTLVFTLWSNLFFYFIKVLPKKTDSHPTISCDQKFGQVLDFI